MMPPAALLLALPLAVPAADAPAPSFRNEVIPVLTRAGCNSGACHGALAGKGGLKLSLRGYDPAADHFVLTRQALARRVDLSRPENSLLLTKATRAIPHGGGRRFADDSPNYHMLRAWIESGALGPETDDTHITKFEVFPKAVLLK